MIRKSLTLVSILTFTAVWSACDSSSEEPAGPPEGFTHISCLDVDGACHQILSGDADDLQERTNLFSGCRTYKGSFSGSGQAVRWSYRPLCCCVRAFTRRLFWGWPDRWTNGLVFASTEPGVDGLRGRRT